MTYSPTTWSDEVPNTSPVKYTIRNSAGAILYDDVQIDIKTTVTAGTPVNAANMNKIEQGLVTLENATPPKVFTANGDLFIGTGSGTGVRLAVTGGGYPLLTHDDDFTNRVGWIYPAFHMRTRESSQNIASGSETIVDYATAGSSSDSGSVFSITTGSSWKCTINKSGWYLIVASITYSSSTDWANGEYANLRIYKNGSQLTQLDMKNYMSGVATQVFLSGMCLEYFVATNYIDIRALQNSGVTQTLVANGIYNRFTIAKLR